MESEKPAQKAESEKKLLEGPILGNWAVPIAIVLVGALIIFGVSKMLRTERSYRDLVLELQSKTFGNRWIAALELSKVIAGGAIPEKEIPWLLENMEEIYKNSSNDERTRNFIVIASDALRDERALPLLMRTLDDPSPKVKFGAVVALGNMPKGVKPEWLKVKEFLSSDDAVLQQAAILALATHKVGGVEKEFEKFLSSEQAGLRYSAAIGLINYKNTAAIPILKEIFSQSTNGGVAPEQWRALKLNALFAIGENKWVQLKSLVEQVEKNESDLRVIAGARETLNKLKK